MITLSDDLLKAIQYDEARFTLSYDDVNENWRASIFVTPISEMEYGNGDTPEEAFEALMNKTQWYISELIAQREEK